MTDEQPVEPDAIIERDGAAVPYRRAGNRAAPVASHTLMPVLARMAAAGPVLTASAFAISALAAAKSVELAGRTSMRARRNATTVAPRCPDVPCSGRERPPQGRHGEAVAAPLGPGVAGRTAVGQVGVPSLPTGATAYR